MVSRKQSFHFRVSHLIIHQTHHVYWLAIKKQHFVQVYLKPECPIPKKSPEWTTHFTQDAETCPDHFLERMEELTKLRDIELEANMERLKNKPPIYLGSDICFDAF